MGTEEIVTPTTTPTTPTTTTTIIDAYRIVRDPILNLIYVQNWSVTCPVEKASEEEAKLQAQGFKIAKDERDKAIMRMQVIQPPPITDESHDAQLQYLQDISDDEFFDLYLANIEIAKHIVPIQFAQQHNYVIDPQQNQKDKELLISEVKKIDDEARSRLLNDSPVATKLASTDIDALRALQTKDLVDTAPTAIAIIEQMKAKVKLDNQSVKA
ncbi:MAG: hypothetical protein QW052_05835 [Candidatus Nitrosocaldaceae archaeon]